MHGADAARFAVWPHLAAIVLEEVVLNRNGNFDAAGFREGPNSGDRRQRQQPGIVEAYLSDSGYRVDTIDNATEAIRLLQKERYDLVLMDIQMPVMDGVTATRCIRALANAVKDMPIIAMTANVLPQQVRSFLDAGMNAHIGKPFDHSKLRNSVRRWLPSTVGEECDVAHSSPRVASTDHVKRPAFDTFRIDALIASPRLSRRRESGFNKPSQRVLTFSWQAQETPPRPFRSTISTWPL